MNLFKRFWQDENGSVLTAEAAILGTVTVLGATVGMNAAAESVNQELFDLSRAIRSLDQSYSFSGLKSPHAFTAGSEFIQQDVKTSLQELGELEYVPPQHFNQPDHGSSTQESHHEHRDHHPPKSNSNSNSKSKPKTKSKKTTATETPGASEVSEETPDLKLDLDVL